MIVLSGLSKDFNKTFVCFKNTFMLIRHYFYRDIYNYRGLYKPAKLFAT